MNSIIEARDRKMLLTQSNDLNNITEEHVEYYWINPNYPTHAPASLGSMRVIANRSNITQIVFAGNGVIFIRTKSYAGAFPDTWKNIYSPS